MKGRSSDLLPMQTSSRKKFSDAFVCTMKGNSQLRDSPGFAPDSHFNRLCSEPITFLGSKGIKFLIKWAQKKWINYAEREKIIQIYKCKPKLFPTFFFFTCVFSEKATKKYPPPMWRISFEGCFALFSLIHKLLSVLDADATITSRDALAL